MSSKIAKRKTDAGQKHQSKKIAELFQKQISKSESSQSRSVSKPEVIVLSDDEDFESDEVSPYFNRLRSAFAAKTNTIPPMGRKRLSRKRKAKSTTTSPVARESDENTVSALSEKATLNSTSRQGDEKLSTVENGTSVEDVEPTGCKRNSASEIPENAAHILHAVRPPEIPSVATSNCFITPVASAQHVTENVKPLNTDEGNLNVAEDQNNTDKQPAEEYAVPYYLENFEFILKHVMSDEYFAYLFNCIDLTVVQTFQDLPDESKKVYVRLFGRNYRWLTPSKIVYPKISSDLGPYLQELVRVGLLQDETSMDDVNEVLKSLPASGLKTLAKSLHINPNQPMKTLITAIHHHSHKSGITSFFTQPAGLSSNNAIKKVILKRAKEHLGRCFRLEKESRSVFLRVIMLFGLHNTRGEDEELAAGQTLLFQMLMSNIGKIKYPEYKVYRTRQIFRDRDSLIQFAQALQLEVNIISALESKKFDDAYEIYQTVQELFKQHLHSKAHCYDLELADFLRSFTAGAVYGRVMNYGVEACQFLKRYDEAVTLLQDLLQQPVYNANYRGRWYDRLALNLDYHLKKPAEALECIKKGLHDEFVRKGFRYALFLRAQKICSTSSRKFKSVWKEFEQDEMSKVKETPKMTVIGRTISHGLPGTPNVYIKEDPSAPDEDFSILKRVEDVVLNYCQRNGYPEGVHAEGSIFSFILALYFWDILFCENIPDVFYNIYQTFPLDFYHKSFYSSRKEQIDKRIQELKDAKESELLSWLEEAFESHKDTYCIGVNWELFRDVDHAKGFVACIGGQKLAAILDRMIKDPRFTRGGMPDLVVWNPQLKTFKVIEVKGPGDRLSTKQILWIDYMIQHDIDACVCHVQAVDFRKL